MNKQIVKGSFIDLLVFHFARSLSLLVELLLLRVWAQKQRRDHRCESTHSDSNRVRVDVWESECQVFDTSALVEEKEVVDVDEDEGGDDDQLVGARSHEQASFEQIGHQVDHLCHYPDQMRCPLHDEGAIVEPGEEARERRQPAQKPEEHEECRC